MTAKIISTTILLSFLHFGLKSQSPNIGELYVQNFEREIYGASTQNHDLAIGENGHVYVANNDGLLIYNGSKWDIVSLPYKTVVRSLLIDRQNRLYVGGQDEFGYFNLKQSGTPQFISLKDQIPDVHQSFQDVWDIIDINAKVVFCSGNKLFMFENEQCRVFEHDRTIRHIFKAAGQVFINDRNAIHVFDPESFKILSSYGFPEDTEINGIVEKSDGELLVATLKKGIYTLDLVRGFESVDWEMNEDLKGILITDLKVIGRDMIAIASGLEGLLILDGDQKLLYQVNRRTGLQNNSILSMAIDGQQNIWLGLSDGVSFVEANSPYTRFFPDGQLEGTVYDILIDGQKMFVGTNNGLYVADWQSYYPPGHQDNFKLVAGTEGQVWSISKAGNDIILNHNDGCFHVINDKAISINQETGSWLWLEINEFLALEGNYNGLALYRKESGIWTKAKQFKDFYESARFLIDADDYTFWASHPYRGVYRFSLSNDYEDMQVKMYDESDGLPESRDLYIYEIENNPYVVHPSGIFTYNATNDKFERNTSFDELHPGYSVRYLHEDGQGNIWYAGEEPAGRMIIRDVALDKEVSIDVKPGLNKSLVGGFENIYDFDINNTFICTQNGVIHLNHSKERHNSELAVGISSIVGGIGDSLLYNQYFQAPDTAISISLPYQGNQIKLTATSSHHTQFDEHLFSFYLEGFDREWTAWTKSRFKEYTNIPPGTYTLSARVQDALGNIEQSKTFELIIGRAWYQQSWAYGIYILFAAGILYFFYGFQNKKSKRVQADLEEQKVQTERALVRVQNEKLAADIAHKNRELASATMHLLQKSETIAKLKDEIEKISQNVKDVKAKKEIKKALELFRNDMQLESDWEHFSRSFDKVHSDFLKRLREEYPQLSAKDQKLCAYLRMNLSTKEIAPLLNISVRGVEIGRYRLRKKLELDSAVNLNEFMISF